MSITAIVMVVIVARVCSNEDEVRVLVVGGDGKDERNDQRNRYY